jgi:hypothetical protein
VAAAVAQAPPPIGYQQKVDAAEAHSETLQARLVAAEAHSETLQRQARHSDVSFRFLKSLANTYPKLYFEITSVEDIAPIPEVEAGYSAFKAALPADCTQTELMTRDVFHSCPADVLPLILAGGMQPSQCQMCRGQAPFIEHDCGWFGKHTDGVYVSKHADYTFHYQHAPGRKPAAGDEGAVIMLETVTGKVKHFDQRRDGAPPTAGFHCHASTKYLEFYVWDDETQAEPPRSTHRVVPRFVIRWRAVRNTRKSVAHDQ